MDSERIEQIAVNTITNEALKYSLLQPRIQSADKIPSWDGGIEVYNTAKHSKSNLSGFVHVQVKGKLAKDLTQPTIPYSVDVSDLVNYRDIQGTLLFVVLINSEQPTQRQIYYAPLLPADLEPLLKKTKNKTGQKTIHCARLPNGHPNLEDICVNFIMNEHLQRGQAADVMMTLQEATNKSLSTCLHVRSQPQHLLENLFNTKHYLYAQNRLSDNKIINIPIMAKGCVRAIQRRITLSANNELIANNVLVTIYNKNKADITIQPNLSIRIDGTNMKLDYQEKGSTEERIQTIKIMNQLCKASTLEGNGRVIITTDQPPIQKAKKLQQRIAFLEDLDKILKFWGVNQEINFNLLTPSCLANVNALAIAVTEPNHQIVLPERLEEEASLQFVKIANLSILVLFIHVKDNIYILENFFNLPNRKFFILAGNQQIPSSRYIIVNAKQYEQASNIPWNLIEQDLCSVPFSIMYGKSLNETLLAMLNAYDLNKNPQLLTIIQSVNTYLLKHEPDNIYNIINQAQIVYRIQSLPKDIKDTLLRIQREQQDPPVKLGIAILLNQPHPESIYSKLTPQQQKAFDSWPISHLWKRR